MRTILIDDATAAGLASLAEASGLSVEDYLKQLAGRRPRGDSAAPAEIDFDEELSRLSFRGPTLPAGFDRADIYHDHD